METGVQHSEEFVKHVHNSVRRGAGQRHWWRWRVLRLGRRARGSGGGLREPRDSLLQRWHGMMGGGSLRKDDATAVFRDGLQRLRGWGGVKVWGGVGFRK